MSFPRYPEYKDSGVEWLGEVPAHWEVAALKYLVSMKSGGTPSKDNRDYWDGDIPWASAKDLKVDYLLDTADHITQDAVDAGASLIPAGSLLVVVRGMILAKVFPVIQTLAPMAINQDLKALQPKPGVDSRYFSWLLRGAEKESMRRTDEAGHGTKALRMDIWSAMPMPVPTACEQREITTFLDRETTKIDGLMAEQKKLIALLKEKRQAVISQAVTKGLDPAVPMKDSGVEWLGNVPESWDVKRLASISTKITNGYVGPTRDILLDDGVRYLQSLHIKNNEIRFNEPYFVSLQWSLGHQKSILQTGDVLIVQTGDIGQVAVVTEEFEGCNCHALIIVSPLRTVILGEWLSWVLNSEYGFHSLLSIQTGALHPHLNCGNVKELFIPVPPLEAQAEAVKHLAAETSKFDELISTAQTAIDLLKERRTALISAAVTGQIDVRGLAKDEQEQAA